MARAPYPYVDPTWISLTAEAGAHFNEPASNTRPANAIPPAGPTQTPFTPYITPQPPIRSTYGPFRAQHSNPTFAPSPPTSPRRSTLDPTVRPFTPKQSPPRPVIETAQEQAHGTIASNSPRTPRIEFSPAEDDVTGHSAAAAQAVQQLLEARRGSSPGRQPTGLQRRRSNSHRRLPVRQITLPPTPTPMPRPKLQHPGIQALHNADSVRAWLPGPYAVGYNGQPFGLPLNVQSPYAASSPQTPARPTYSRSATGTTSSSSRQYFCSDANCPTPEKAYATRGDLNKHARTHLPMSARPYGCRAMGCSQRFWWPKDQGRHELRVHGGATVQCVICGGQLSREDNLTRHVATVHKDIDAPATPSSMTMPSPAMSTMTSFAQTPRSEYSLTVPSTPPSSATQYFPPSDSRVRASRHMSFTSARGPPPAYYGAKLVGSHAMEKSPSAGF